MSTFTVFIPVYNEEELIVENTKKLLKYMDSLKVEYDVMIGSNGSTDRTVDLGKYLEKKSKKVKFFHVEKKGVGTAFKKAIAMSKSDFIISVDMDLSVELKYIEEAIKLTKDYDIIVGSKQMGTQERSILRKIPSFVFTTMTRLLFGLSYKDYSLAAKTYRREILEKNMKWIDEGTSYVINIIYFAKRQRYRIIEIPVSCNDTRKSKFNILHESWYRFWKLIRLRLKS